ncbi:MAG: LicD family protein [Lachnospiraceae bacterium]|nr:LicD family protein [Lachnospiraceae bacterium]
MNNSIELSMKEIQNGSLNILCEIDKICKRLNLHYYLAYGTLLGAVRHHGFIPWDDDIDIMMPREDYKRLIKFFMENEKEVKPLELFSYYNNKKYPHMISRISDSRYILDVDNENDYGLGLFVDIYPMDGIGNTKEEYIRRKNLASKYSSLCFLSTREHFEFGTTKGMKKKILKIPAYFYAKMKGKNFFLEKLEIMSAEKKYDEEQFIGCLVWGTDGVKAVFPKEWFKSSVGLEFEGMIFQAPIKYHEVLSRLYGDYMKIPPKEKQVGHHFYRAYKKV